MKRTRDRVKKPPQQQWKNERDMTTIDCGGGRR